MGVNLQIEVAHSISLVVQVNILHSSFNFILVSVTIAMLDSSIYYFVTFPMDNNILFLIYRWADL